MRRFLFSGVLILGLVMLGVTFDRQQLPEIVPIPTAPIPTPQPSPTPVLTTCQLITSTELRDILNAEVSSNQPVSLTLPNQIEQETCLWTATSGAYTPTASIQQKTKLDATSIEEYWLSEQEITKTRPRYADLPDLGEAAFSSSEGVTFLLNNQILSILVSLPDPTKNQSTAEAIARIIEQKLK